MPTVRVASTEDLPAAGRALAAAFADDPVWTWMVPDGRWDRNAPRFFEVISALQQKSGGQVLVDDEIHGAAVWAAPGHGKLAVLDVVRLLPAGLRLFGVRHQVRALRALSVIEKHHPTEPPHWYLEFVGTRPDQQGKGIGSALIGEITERCDAEGLPAYLESSNESNIPLYARHGFELRDEIHLPSDGPTMWPMWREPHG